MLKPDRRPDPLMILALLAVVVFLVLAACVHVDGDDEEDDCDEVGLSAVTATRTSKPVDRPRTSVSKAPAPAAKPRTARTPSATSSTTAPDHARPHGGGHHDLDLCD